MSPACVVCVFGCGKTVDDDSNEFNDVEGIDEVDDSSESNNGMGAQEAQS